MSSDHRARNRPRLLAALLLPALLALGAGPAWAYTIEFCNEYADRVVREATGTQLTYAMRTTPGDSSLGGIAGTGTGGDDGSLSSILRELSEPQEQQTLWQQTFNNCMGATR
jgi:hypothetical protein